MVLTAESTLEEASAIKDATIEGGPAWKLLDSSSLSADRQRATDTSDKLDEHIPRPVDSTISRSVGPDEAKVLRARQLARTLQRDIELTLTLLSFVEEQGIVNARQLVLEAPPEALGQILDLHELGLLEGRGSDLAITARGRDLLRRAGLSEGE